MREEAAAIKAVFGNLRGLKPAQTRRLQNLYGRRIPPQQSFTQEIARALTEISAEIGRQVGLLVDRRGRIDFVMVGDASRIFLPDFGRLRAGAGRLRGLRYLHTHLADEPLSRDDLTDLAKLRFDLVTAIGVGQNGLPGLAHVAHLLPENPQGRLWQELEPAPAHAVAVELDFPALVTALEEEFARAARAREADTSASRAVLVSVTEGAQGIAEWRLRELAQLCESAGLTVADRLLQRRSQPDPRFLVGRGKLEEIILRALQMDAEMLVFDSDLTPAQIRAIAELTELKVVDRTQLILDIFAQRAQSRDGKLQVELAQLRYLLPRLSLRDSGLSRLTGGIGGRGPGETKLEIDRRRARDRIRKLDKQIGDLSKRRALRRRQRQRSGLPVVSIVGYTNAGKSTLLNVLTESEVLVEDKLFATLDPVSRRLRFPRDREVVITDTVGFIRDLPPDLVRAFRATLEELYDADLLLHVADASDPELESQVAAVRRILSELELDGVARLLVLNKTDRLEPDTAEAMARSLEGVPISALEPETLARLLERIEARLWRGATRPATG